MGLLIFLAIIMHKAPASIGFGTFLTHHGLKGWAQAKHILAFTITSPIVASASYFMLKNFGMSSSKNEE